MKVELPKEIIKSAEKIGMSKKDLIETMKDFAILDVIANLSKLDEKEAGSLIKKIKESAWKIQKESYKHSRVDEI